MSDTWKNYQQKHKNFFLSLTIFLYTKVQGDKNVYLQANKLQSPNSILLHSGQWKLITMRVFIMVITINKSKIKGR